MEFMKYAAMIISLVSSSKQSDYIKSVLSDENMYGNSDFMKHIKENLIDIEDRSLMFYEN